MVHFFLVQNEKFLLLFSTPSSIKTSQTKDQQKLQKLKTILLFSFSFHITSIFLRKSIYIRKETGGQAKPNPLDQITPRNFSLITTYILLLLVLNKKKKLKTLIQKNNKK